MQLIIDPLDGPWRGCSRLFNGAGKALTRELARLRGLLSQHDTLCAIRGLSSGSGSVVQRSRAAPAGAASAAAEQNASPSQTKQQGQDAMSDIGAVSDVGEGCQGDRSSGVNLGGCSFPLMPWLPGLLADFRRRRRAALVHEIERLEGVERVTSAARDLVAAARGIGKLSVK